MSPLVPEAVIRLLAAANGGNSPDCCRSIQQSPMSAVADEKTAESSLYLAPTDYIPAPSIHIAYPGKSDRLARTSLIFFPSEILAPGGMTPTDFILRDHREE